MVILFAIVSCYLLRVIPKEVRPVLLAIWGFCCAGFFCMINELIVVNSLLLVRAMTTIAFGGCGTLVYALREEYLYNKRKAHLLRRWKNEVTLENAA